MHEQLKVAKNKILLSLIILIFSAFAHASNFCEGLFLNNQDVDILKKTSHLQFINNKAETEPVIFEINFPFPTELPFQQLQVERNFLGFFKKFIMWNPFNRYLARSKLFDQPTSTQKKFKDFLLTDLQKGLKYNFVIASQKITIAPTSKNKINDFLSKHILLANAKDVEFAGTLTILNDGTVVITNESGSYKPSVETLNNIKLLFEEYYDIPYVITITPNDYNHVISHSFAVDQYFTQSITKWFDHNDRLPNIRSQNTQERLAAIATIVLLRSKSLALDLLPLRITNRLQNINLRQSSHLGTKYVTIPLQSKFVGEENGKVIYSVKLQKNILFQTQYFKAGQEREKYRLTIANGIVHDANYNTYDTTDAKLNGLSNSTQRALVVMDENGAIYALKEQEMGRLHHSTLLAGAPVAFAGEILVKDGNIKTIKNLSGHYLPEPILFIQFLNALQNAGVNINTISLELP